MSASPLLPGFTCSALLALFIVLASTTHKPVAAATGEEALSLASDNWQFETDPDDIGISGAWWKRELGGSVKLPGSMTESGLGDDITSATPWTQQQPRLKELLNDPKLAPYLQPGNVKVPFWLTPLKYYKGAAWYQREFTVPEKWSGKALTLSLERPHWRTDVWIDDKAVGFRESLSTPHDYDLGSLRPGKHRLTIRVDNRLQVKVGLNAHSVTDHTQTNWNGIVGKIELRPGTGMAISSVKAIPDIAANGVRFVTELRNQHCATSLNWVETTVRLKGESADAAHAGPVTVRSNAKAPNLTTFVELSEPAKLWDEFDQNLYEATVNLYTLDDNKTTALADSRTVTFGFRDFSTSGTEFVVNGRPTFLRGTLECCIFPLTGYPPMEIESWLRIMKVIKAHGLNHIRFHSWCPPEAAFDAADQAGVYLSVECASWSKVPGQDPAYDKWLYAESERIVTEYGNHPSFCMLLYGNEPGGDKKTYHAFLNKFVADWKGRDDRFLVSGGAGWPAISHNEFHILQQPRIQHWGEGLKSRVNARPPETTTDYEDYITSFSVPIISHEIGQWCVYPVLDEREKYTGVTRALNFDIFEDTLTKNHMRDQADDFVAASGELQALLYKEDIESALRTKGMGGFQLLDLHDFPGQGTALVGVLDPFWDSKGYITAPEYKSFTGPVVPLASLSKRIFTNDEHLTCTIELANYGKEALNDVAPEWKVTRDGGDVLASGKFAQQDFPVGNGLQIGAIDEPLDKISDAEKLTLHVSIPGTDAANSWDIWVYPVRIDTSVPEDILLTHHLDAAASSHLADGGKVLLIPDPAAIRGDGDGKVVPGFSSIFWNTAWTGGQAPHTLGILCDPEHAALASFPTESHSNWQWWYICHDSPVMLLDSLQPGMRPIIQMIDDWTKNRRLGYLFEGTYGGGKLMVCSMQLGESGNGDPVLKQILHSILEYIKSDAFSPKDELSKEALSGVLDISDRN